MVRPITAVGARDFRAATAQSNKVWPVRLWPARALAARPRPATAGQGLGDRGSGAGHARAAGHGAGGRAVSGQAGGATHRRAVQPGPFDDAAWGRVIQHGPPGGRFQRQELGTTAAAFRGRGGGQQDVVDHQEGLRDVTQNFHPGYGDYGAAVGRNSGPRRGFLARAGRGVKTQRGGRAGRSGRGAGRSTYAAATSHGLAGELSQGATADTGVPPEDQHMEMEMEMASAGAGEHAGKSKVICGRCFQKDHATADCTNDVYCYICDGHDHVNHRCPVLKLSGLLGGGAGLPSHTRCSSASEGGVHDCSGDSCRRSHL